MTTLAAADGRPGDDEQIRPEEVGVEDGEIGAGSDADRPTVIVMVDPSRTGGEGIQGRVEGESLVWKEGGELAVCGV